jgi:hypothetical protein
VDKNLVAFSKDNFYHEKKRKGIGMKKILFSLIVMFSLIPKCHAYQVISTKEYGKNDAKNQNITVMCTTDTGKESPETCSLRRYAKCSDKNKKICNTWQPWRILRDSGSTYADWKAAASDCCKKKGLR